jgi:hypothetical protein
MKQTIHITLTLAERCEILRLRTEAGDEWGDDPKMWLSWAVEAAQGMLTDTEQRVVGALIEELGARMQRATKGAS